METEATLVDYGYGSSSPTTATFRNSDNIDYRDVFGGPPRRSTVHEMMRYSFTEGADSFRLGKTPSFRDPWSSAEEKPVFGGGGEGGNRRRYVREGFFVDIFGGSELPSSATPRKLDRDVFSASSPGSRTLSPARPLPPRAEGFLGLSSGPTQFSLPDKLSKSVDSPAIGSPTRTLNKDTASNDTSHLHSPKISIFGFSSSRTVLVQDESTNNGTYYRPSPLSQQFSQDSSGLMKPERSDDPGKDAGNPSGPQFHFSIYKWASRGIPSMMPLRRASSLRMKEKGKTGSSSFNERRETRSEMTESPSATPLDVSSLFNSNEVLGNLSSKFKVEACQSAGDEVLLSQKHDAVGHEWNDKVEDIPVRSATKDRDVSSGPHPPNLIESSDKEMNGGLQKLGRPELKPLHAFFHDKDDKDQSDRNDVIDRKVGGTNRISKGSSRTGNSAKDFKKQDEDLSIRTTEKAEKFIAKGSPRSSEDSAAKKKRSKGKVKEFIKIFNQETPPTKPKASVHPQNPSPTNKEIGPPEATEEANIHRNAAVNERRSVSESEKPRDDSNKVADPRKESPKEYSAANSPDILCTGTSSGQKDNSASSTESVPDDVRVTAEDADESSRTFFTVKELPAQDEKKQVQSTEDREEIQAIDAKIRQWSRGKEGNIRSLLSTLQYVLWPGSGWKPVPLVDIIEGPAVKRSYQRALLYLHPDKLQQKGAAWHQKYTAEQVFDILQEAWTHFNTLGGL